MSIKSLGSAKSSITISPVPSVDEVEKDFQKLRVSNRSNKGHPPVRYTDLDACKEDPSVKTVVSRLKKVKSYNKLFPELPLTTAIFMEMNFLGQLSLPLSDIMIPLTAPHPGCPLRTVVDDDNSQNTRTKLWTRHVLSTLFMKPTGQDIVCDIGPYVCLMSLSDIRRQSNVYGGLTEDVAAVASTTMPAENTFDRSIGCRMKRKTPRLQVPSAVVRFSEGSVLKLTGDDACRIIEVQVNVASLRHAVLYKLSLPAVEFEYIIQLRQVLTTAFFYHHILLGEASEVLRVQRLCRQQLSLTQAHLCRILPSVNSANVCRYPQEYMLQTIVEYEKEYTLIRGYSDLIIGQKTIPQLQQIEREINDLSSDLETGNLKKTSRISLEQILESKKETRRHLLNDWKALGEDNRFGECNQSALGQAGLQLFARREALGTDSALMCLLQDGVFNAMMLLDGQSNDFICTPVAATDELATLYDIMALRYSPDEVLALLTSKECCVNMTVTHDGGSGAGKAAKEEKNAKGAAPKAGKGPEPPPSAEESDSYERSIGEGGGDGDNNDAMSCSSDNSEEEEERVQARHFFNHIYYRDVDADEDESSYE